MNFEWNALTTSSETGKATITHYNLRVRPSTSTSDADWEYLTGSSDYLTLTYSQTSGYISGGVYHY